MFFELWTSTVFVEVLVSELLLAIEDGREPGHGARDNLRSLELCFAAVASADSGQPVKPGSARAVAK